MPKILEKRLIRPPDVFYYKVEARRLARKARPGQFVIIRLNEQGERIPLSLADIDAEGGTIRLIVMVVGKTTAEMSLLEEGDPRAPVCTSCHASHGIAEPDEAWKADVVEECGACHERLYETYFESYHGKVTQLGDTDIAKCYDCHGSHTVLPADDPRSEMHPDNRLESCRECHPDTTENFADFVSRLRECCPGAQYDERLLTRAGQAALLGPTLNPEEHLSVATALLAKTLMGRT